MRLSSTRAGERHSCAGFFRAPTARACQVTQRRAADREAPPLPVQPALKIIAKLAQPIALTSAVNRVYRSRNDHKQDRAAVIREDLQRHCSESRDVKNRAGSAAN